MNIFSHATKQQKKNSQKEFGSSFSIMTSGRKYIITLNLLI